MMRKTKRIPLLSFAVLLFVLAACQTDEQVGGLEKSAGRVDLNVSAIGFQNAVGTRSAEKESFEQGDRIRLYYNQRYTDLQTPDGNTWTPNLQWRDIGGTGEVRFVGVSASSGSGSITNYRFDIPLNQSKKEDYRAADLMSAVAVASPGNRVQLNFNHLLCRVRVNLSGLAEHPLVVAGEKVEVEVNTFPQATFDLQNQSGSAITTQQETKWIKTYRYGNSFYAIVPPQSMSAFRGADAWIRLTIGGKSTSFQAPAEINGTDFGAIRSGNEIVVNLSVKELKPEFSNSTQFVYGVTIPENVNWTFGLAWKPEQGWFDVDKVSPEPQTGFDSNMCWAASASNLIHWWVRNNKEYIERYERQTGQKWGPAKYEHSLKSEVFEWVKSKKANTSGRAVNVVNLYLMGVYYDRYEYREVVTDDIDDPLAGFALPIMGKTVLVQRYGNPGMVPLSKAEFNKGIKTALSRKRAVSFSIPQHALNLWGADFDENGDVSHIYAVDNNNNPNTLLRTPVKYSDGGTYITNSLGYITSRTAIVHLALLDLGEDLWKAYFGE